MPTEEEWFDAGMGADDSLGHPARRTPQEGIREMQQRLRLLNARARHPNLSAAELHTLNSEIETARQRLAEYRAQLEGRN